MAVGGGGGRVLLVHSEIYYVPIGDSWEEVLVRNVSVSNVNDTKTEAETFRYRS